MSFWIRPAHEEDLDEIVALNDLAFGGKAEGRIVRELAKSGESVLSLVASDDAGIVGHLQFFRVHVDGAPAVGLGPMSVHPDFQNTGIGSGLIQMGLMALEGSGESLVFVLGHPDYYPRFGFSAEVAAPYESDWSGEAFMALQLSDEAPAPGRLTYPAAFG
ncbi:MAG: N-acetyltransferase [Alphaproteobacteria bacterium]|nr:N-acetyltransferase [Alphaproteobacteria bacterium]|tara:strand:- start:2855 stop:3337 length:483 start_codon:yes stop_codon:yes gene_type:complete